MRAPERLIAVFLFSLCGCAGTGAPAGWLPDAEEAARDPYGSWIRVKPAEGEGHAELVGELIAVDADTLWMLSATRTPNKLQWSETLGAVPWDQIREVKLGAYDPQAGLLGGWGLLGTLSTASHGFFLVISAPIWIAGSATFTHSAAKNAIIEAKDPNARSYLSGRAVGIRYTRVEELRPYARFPAGLPPGLTRVRPKP